MQIKEVIKAPLSLFDYFERQQIYFELSVAINSGAITEKQVCLALLEEDDEELSSGFLSEFIDYAKKSVIL